MFARAARISGALIVAMANLVVASSAQQSAEALYKEAASAYDRGDVQRAISL